MAGVWLAEISCLYYPILFENKPLELETGISARQNILFYRYLINLINEQLYIPLELLYLDKWNRRYGSASLAQKCRYWWRQCQYCMCNYESAVKQAEDTTLCDVWLLAQKWRSKPNNIIKVKATDILASKHYYTIKLCGTPEWLKSHNQHLCCDMEFIFSPIQNFYYSYCSCSLQILWNSVGSPVVFYNVPVPRVRIYPCHLNSTGGWYKVHF